MRIAILSDIHGNLRALEAVFEDIGRRRVDQVLDLGDRVSGPLWPRETFDEMSRRGIPGVRGNHDRLAGSLSCAGLGASDRHAFEALDAQSRAALAALPFRRIFLPGIEGFHATPDHDDRYLMDDIHEGRLVRAAMSKIERRLGGPRAPILLMGHSHRADVIRLGDGTILLNPGSVGCPAYQDDTGVAHVSEAGTPHARYAILDCAASFENPEITFCMVAYDHDAAARQASANGRPDWAHALRTGWLPPP